MSNDKKYTNSYSADDIVRYHQGIMSAEEMHSLEKAALEDPFLADALEGYSTRAGEAGDDLMLLDKRLAERIAPEKGKVIRGWFNYWFKLAAILVVLVASSVALYQMFKFEDKSLVPSIAKTNTTEEVPKQLSKDAGPAVKSGQEEEKPAPLQKDIVVKKAKDKEPAAEISTEEPEPKKVAGEVAIRKNVADTITEIQTAKADTKKEEMETSKSAEPLAAARSKSIINTAPTAQEGIAENKIKQNVFKGIVVDQKNNPLPFANITIQNYNIGTYADARGNFRLVAPDSLLNVEVRSLGHILKQDTLLGNNAGNKIVLEPLAESAERAYKMNTGVADIKNLNDNRRTMKSEVTEPEDGWANYDIYLDNNRKLSEFLSGDRRSGEVLISFELNDAGRPINLKIEKSLCDECDSEALRLIREGPQWKSKSRNARGRVTVRF